MLTVESYDNNSSVGSALKTDTIDIVIVAAAQAPNCGSITFTTDLRTEAMVVIREYAPVIGFPS